ncbi:MAG: FAD-dependent oxidoreductase [Acidobacteriota bacterium]|nr:FAD-dependent oxidoreductase [Acidobacteriota bacterium]
MSKGSVLVIGAGAVGICTAWYLRRAGYEVSVIDKGKAGAACSSGNAGLLVPSHIVPLAAPGVVAQGIKWMFNSRSPFYIKPRLSGALISWAWKFRGYCTEDHVQACMPVLHDLIQESMSLFDELAAEENIQIYREGLLMLYRTVKGQKDCVSLAKQAQALGLPVRVLDNNGLRDLEPNVRTETRGAVYFEQDAHLDPTAMIDQLTKQLRADGVEIMEDTEVTRLETARGRVTSVRTTAGEHRPDQIVLCGGAWSPDIAEATGMRLPIQAGKGYSLTLPAGDIRPRIPMILAEEKATVTPMGDQLRFSGTMELSGLDSSVNRKRVESILDIIPKYLPDIDPAAIRTENVWSGFRPCTPDGLPLIGRARGMDNLAIASGHAMIGITLAPVTGRLITHLLDGKPMKHAAELRPDRFN